jgi:DNA-binding MarR family transcriptional regulator
VSDDAQRIAEAMVLLTMRSTRRELHEEITRGVHPAVDAVSYPILSGIGRVGPINSARLGPVVGLDRSFVSRLADRLIDADLLRRTIDSADRRATLLVLTEEGERVVAVLRRRLVSATERVLEDWTTAERQLFAELMNRFVDQLASGRAWTNPGSNAASRSPDDGL